MYLEQRYKVEMRAIDNKVEAQRVKENFFSRQDPLTYLLDLLHKR